MTNTFENTYQSTAVSHTPAQMPWCIFSIFCSFHFEHNPLAGLKMSNSCPLDESDYVPVYLLYEGDCIIDILRRFAVYL